MRMTARPRHDLHEFGRGTEEAVELLGAFFDLQPPPQIWLLGRNTDRTVIGVAGPHSQAADCLEGGVGYSDGICAEGQGFDKIRRQPQTAGDD